MALFSSSDRGKLAVVYKPLTQQWSTMEEEPAYLHKSHPLHLACSLHTRKAGLFKPN